MVIVIGVGWIFCTGILVAHELISIQRTVSRPQAPHVCLVDDSSTFSMFKSSRKNYSQYLYRKYCKWNIDSHNCITIKKNTYPHDIQNVRNTAQCSRLLTFAATYSGPCTAWRIIARLLLNAPMTISVAFAVKTF